MGWNLSAHLFSGYYLTLLGDGSEELLTREVLCHEPNPHKTAMSMLETENLGVQVLPRGKKELKA